MVFDPMKEIPTFSQYKIGKEVNECSGATRISK